MVFLPNLVCESSLSNLLPGHLIKLVSVVMDARVILGDLDIFHARFGQKVSKTESEVGCEMGVFLHDLLYTTVESFCGKRYQLKLKMGRKKVSQKT